MSIKDDRQRALMDGDGAFANDIVTLRAVGSGPPAIVRIRRALKCLLRAFGLRCTGVAETPSNPPAYARAMLRKAKVSEAFRAHGRAPASAKAGLK